MNGTYHEARNQALEELLRTRPDVHLVGNAFETPFEPPNRFARDFPDQVHIAPISEFGFTALAVGAALSGLHPIVDFSTASFAFNAWEPLVNEAANLRYMSGGALCVPAIFHVLSGARGSAAEQHSHAIEAMLWNVPGLKILCPSTPQDVYSLLLSAALDPDPVVFIDPIPLFGVQGSWDPELIIPLGQARVHRTGRDVTVAAVSSLVPPALQAAEALAQEGISVEVWDPCTLVPFDTASLIASVQRTHRLVVAAQTHRSNGVASEIAARAQEGAWDALVAPIQRVALPDVPIPYSPALEAAMIPGPRAIIDAVHIACGQ